MFKALISLSIAIAIPAVLISGCSEREAAKAAVKSALQKQTEMNAFAFAGQADLHLDGLPAGDSSTVPGQLFSFLKDSKLEWKGAASLNPVRWESDLKAASRSGSAELTVPLLFQDNKLFFHMPLLNPDNEYFVTRLGLPPDSPASAADKTGTVPKAAASPPLEHLSRLSSDLSKLLQEGADEAWFESDGEVKLTDGSAARSYTASVTRMNAGAWNKKVQEKLPRLLEALKSNGLISEAQAAEFGRSASSFKLSAPGKWTVIVDEEGFLRKLDMEFKFTGPGGNKSSASAQTFSFQQSFDAVNQTPEFRKPLPRQTKSIDEVLKSLGSAGKQ
ncbi:hypothetical protein [Paenibacillus chitinolyticus]|uniref:hypothetical protein n=1 Tax=Paenibacillus chitinolyticus TaxID=79263 RepID=UPI00366BCCE4